MYLYDSIDGSSYTSIPPVTFCIGEERWRASSGTKTVLQASLAFLSAMLPRKCQQEERFGGVGRANSPTMQPSLKLL